jgi:uncharacterized RDD family membrane protein YckC
MSSTAPGPPSIGPAPQATRVSGRRFVAHLVDSTLYVILFFVAILIVDYLPSGRAADVFLGAVLILGLTVGHVAYFVILQRRSGRTPGKRLARIRVVDAAGSTPSTGALVKRTVPLLIEYFYVIAFIAMIASERRQRFGDRWADTYVVHDDRPRFGRLAQS